MFFGGESNCEIWQKSNEFSRNFHFCIRLHYITHIILYFRIFQVTITVFGGVDDIMAPIQGNVFVVLKQI